MDSMVTRPIAVKTRWILHPAWSIHSCYHVRHHVCQHLYLHECCSSRWVYLPNSNGDIKLCTRESIYVVFGKHVPQSQRGKRIVPDKEWHISSLEKAKTLSRLSGLAGSTCGAVSIFLFQSWTGLGFPVTHHTWTIYLGRFARFEPVIRGRQRL